MRQIQHGPNTPPQLAAAYAADPNPAEPTIAWQEFQGKQELRNDLWPRQNGRCAYCERCIPEFSTPIEHIRPKSKFHDNTFCYRNLVLSCNTHGTCTDHKGADWDNDFIQPTDIRCEQYFSCELNGRIGPADGLSGPDRNAAKLTLEMVNLNHPHLKSARENMLMAIENACADMVGQPDALREFLSAELDDSDHTKPFFSCKLQYFGTPT